MSLVLDDGTINLTSAKQSRFIFVLAMPAFSTNDTGSNEELAARISSKIRNGIEITDGDLKELDSLFRSGDASKLPFLDRKFLRETNQAHPQLVRHVGMVQDMLDPEYYVAQVEGFGSAHFRDLPPSISLSDEELSIGSQLAERQPVLVVPLPFTSNWVEQRINGGESAVSNPEAMKMDQSNPISPLTETRKRERDPQQEQEAASRPDTSKARIVEDENMDLSNAGPEIQTQIASSSKALEWWPVGCNQSSKSQCPILAKFYYDQGADNNRRKLRLNEVVETIGILSMNPWEADFSSSEDDMFFGSTAPPPPSQLTRMHVLSYQVVEMDHLVTNELDNIDVSFFNGLVSDLTNKSLAAQSLFLALLSKAERQRITNFGEEQFTMKQTSSSTVGCMSLEITTKDDSKALFENLKAMLSDHCPIVATVDFATSSAEFPSKVNGRIMPTPWQLPKGSTLLIHTGDSDATRISTLEDLLTFNRIPYQFDGGLKIQFEADYRIIVVSSKPSGKCTLSVNRDFMNTTEWCNEVSKLCLSLHQCRQVGNIQLSQQLLEKAQEDFLAQRALAREDSNKRMPQEEDFHRWLTMTRLQARCRNSNSATIQDWERALSLDNAICYNN